MIEIVTEILNIIWYCIGIIAVFYFGIYIGKDKCNEDVKNALNEKWKFQVGKEYYMEQYNQINHLLQNLTAEDVEMINDDGWNYFILKKSENDNQMICDDCIARVFNEN